MRALGGKAASSAENNSRRNDGSAFSRALTDSLMIRFRVQFWRWLGDAITSQYGST